MSSLLPLIESSAVCGMLKDFCRIRKEGIHPETLPSDDELEEIWSYTNRLYGLDGKAPPTLLYLLVADSYMNGGSISGTPVSYGGTFICERDTRMGVIPIGYADGLHRTLSNKARFLTLVRPTRTTAQLC